MSKKSRKLQTNENQESIDRVDFTINAISKLNSSLNELQTNSHLTDRQSLRGLISKTHNGKRDLYNVFGYDEVLEVDDYIERFFRQDIAKAVINAYPNACWSKDPIISDDKDTKNKTEFEKEFIKLNKKIKLFHYLKRLDVLSRLGHFSVLFISVKDGKKTTEPLDGTFSMNDILFLSPYSEKNASISKYDTSLKSARYGLPELYNLRPGGYGGNSSVSSSSSMPEESIIVHHTRIIHIAEGVLENDVFGTPALQAIVNRLIDLEKIVGGGAEMFWLNSRGGLHLDQPGESNLTNKKEELNKTLEEFANNLTRYLKTKDVTVTPLNFEIADPKNYFDMIISLISASEGIPKRLLLGSEQAQLASSQDKSNWLDKVMARQTFYCEPQLVRQTVDWFINLKILPNPLNDQYDVNWPDLKTTSDNEIADVAVKKTDALKKYLDAPGSDLLITPKQLVEDVLDLDFREDDLPDMDNDTDEEEDDN